MEVKIYDTLTKQKIPVPNKDGKVGIYVCGLTVYDSPHLGHARVFVVFDVLRRVLKENGYFVKYVQNFTDVDDKIIAKAKALGVSPEQVADTYIDSYFKEIRKLNVLDADVYPRATQHIKEIVELVKKIEQNGYAYSTSKGVYFRVQKFKEYGKLSHQSPENLRAGARVEPDPEKEDPLDFSLWKFYKNDPFEPRWPSPWGEGRPGWHIECSAMSMKYLEEIDIHGGGEDLIFPHHENEIAQSEAATGKQFARSWMHVGLLNIGAEKMSKSLRNFVTIDKAVSLWGTNAVRLFLLSAPYRSPLSYSEAALDDAAKNWLLVELSYAETLCPAPRSRPAPPDLLEAGERFKQELTAHLADDLNTPMALNDLLSWTSFVGRFAAKNDGLSPEESVPVAGAFSLAARLLGFELPKKEDEHGELINKRLELRSQKRYSEADAIREQLWKEGLILVDHSAHTVWFRSTVPDAVSRLAKIRKGETKQADRV